MKLIESVWLPDSDTHFAEHLKKGPKHSGHGTYQYKKIKAAMDQNPKNGVALDIGAHVGLWSMVLVDYFQSVIAFEPLLKHTECFEKNLGAYMRVPDPKVFLHKIALGPKPGYVYLHDGGENSGNARVKIKPIVERGDRIRMATLDECILFKNYPITFIKIDVEGYELDVIRGGETTIRSSKPLMVVEQKPGHAQQYGFKETEAIELLKTWGARVKWTKAGDYCLSWA